MDLVALFIAAIFLSPLYWILVSSFKTGVEIFDNNISFWPREFTFNPLVTQFTDSGFLYSLLNSFIIAFLNMALSTVLGAASYGLAVFRFPLKRADAAVYV